MSRMDRRAFARNATSLVGALALAGAGVPLRARAQGFTPLQGRDFQALAKPIAAPADGKIEVIEFFWYACPHCFAFEPAIEPWILKQPPDVRFRRVPVGFDARKEIHQRIFYTWEALGVVDQMHVKTFTRFHIQKKPIDSIDDMVAFAQENGLVATKVRNAWNSFSVRSRCLAAKRLEDDYGIERMPEMAVAGRFVAVARPPAGPSSVLVTTDWLVDRVRHGG
ncbi:MAG: thiol:disulfide interchange protein DsbA/DsbL [Burkholderiaceae bacterium]|jgi:thiol:disulfide interchange protein DsbA